MLAPANEQVQAGLIARSCIELARRLCAEGIEGEQLDKEIEMLIRDRGGKPGLKGYHPRFAERPYEWTICLSLDNEVVHGVPVKYVSPSHLVTVDLVVEYDGWYADTARTFTTDGDCIRRAFADTSMLIFKNALMGIAPRQLTDVYSMFVKDGAQMCRMGIVKEYCGHGIGRVIHDEPQISNYPTHQGIVFEVGKSYAVEPVLAMNRDYALEHDAVDGFSIRANCLTSHNEDTVFVSPHGVINLTDE